MLQRHPPAKTLLPFEEQITGPHAPNTRIALWKNVRRDQQFLDRSAQEIEQLALRLHMQSARARLRADHAEELKLPNLPAADRWWKRQFQQADLQQTGPQQADDSADVA